MKLIVGCDGQEQEAFLGALALAAPLIGASVLFAHVWDDQIEEQWERNAGHHWLRRHPGQSERARFETAAVQSTQEILEEAMTLTAAWPTADRATVELHGNPERELIRVAIEERADLLAVGQHRVELGPHALGRCARFVIDHAPCSFLLVRDELLREAGATLLGDRLQHRPKGPRHR